METEFKLRCRRCRCLVVTDDHLINTHSEPLSKSDTLCANKSTSSVWYVSMETESFPWIQETITKASWTKGKLYCPKCNGRIGSFDFLNSSQCPCGRETLPGVHILCDRVDKIHISNPASAGHLLLNGRLQFIGGATFEHGKQVPVKTCTNVHSKEEGVTVGLDSKTEVSNLSILQIPSQRCRQRRDIVRALDSGSKSSDVCNLPSLRDPVANFDIVPVQEDITPITQRNILSSSLPQTNKSPESSGENHQSRVETFGAKMSDTNISDVSMATSDTPINIRQRHRYKLRKEERRRRRLQNERDEFGLIWGRELKEEVNRFHLLLEENQDEITRDEDPLEDIEDDHVCPVCLDVFLHPHVCLPCRHMFCESCLRQLAQKSDNSTRFYCPMCREPILDCQLKQELSRELKCLYPLTYDYRLLTDRKYLSHRFRLPRSIGTRRPPSSMHSQFMWAVSRSHWALIYMAKHVTFLATIVLLILVLCVSMVL